MTWVGGWEVVQIRPLRKAALRGEIFADTEGSGDSVAEKQLTQKLKGNYDWHF